ncbi:MAG: undecaprenyl-diphosphatase UppP [Candidatus Omnitrophica bacterium]|nr:undecaprenyl-diphosphatase UppP [Candidatus Omnitrophota bacterium]
MNIYEAVVLGIVQGFTEFLPVSSSGHLVLFQNLLGMREPMLAFDVAVHLGTLLAVFVYFGKDLIRMVVQSVLFAVKFPFASDKDEVHQQYPYAAITGFVILASVPTFLIAIAFKDMFEYLFSSVAAVGFAWLVMGILLVLSRWFQESNARFLTMMNHRDAFFIGIAQGIAIIPGISRSGSTILGGMLCGIEKKDAARFSFLIGIPAILGAAVLKMREGIDFFASYPAALIAGFVMSALVGYFVIGFLLKVLGKGKFYLFGYYCLVLSVVTIVYGLLTGGNS